MFNIQILEDYKSNVSLDSIRQAAEAVASYLDVEDKNIISIIIDNNETLHRLNKEYLNIDSSTDVLSFNSNEIDPETGNLYLGDIIVSYPAVLAQSMKYDHNVDNELQLLVIHGFLHLLGYDHDNQDRKEQMWLIQKKILKSIHSPIDQIEES